MIRKPITQINATKTIALGMVSTAFLACGALAGDQEIINKDYKAPVTPTACFKDQELQLDIYGDYFDFPHADDQYEHHRNPGQAGGGGGLGVNYFFMRYIGVGVDGDINSNRGGVADYTGKLIFRLPIELGRFCIAPYVFGGGGGQSDFQEDANYNYRHDHRTQGAYMSGGGVEWRVTPRVGIFTEGRYTWTTGRNNDGDNAQARLGVRIAF